MIKRCLAWFSLFSVAALLSGCASMEWSGARLDEEANKTLQVFREEIDDEHQTPEAIAEAELCVWLSEPAQFAMAPSRMELLDARTLYWPGFDDPVQFQGETFTAGADVRARYRFDTYRVGWRRLMHASERFRWWLGGTLLVQAATSTQLPLSGPANIPGVGSSSLLFAIPNWEGFVGVNLNFQMIILDAGAPFGLLMTNAVELWMG